MSAVVVGAVQGRKSQLPCSQASGPGPLGSKDSPLSSKCTCSYCTLQPLSSSPSLPPGPELSLGGRGHFLQAQPPSRPVGGGVYGERFFPGKSPA